ncbi:glycosyltransferase family 39 protein [Desulfosporosinus sp. FKB]|uniref:glycosyltransferase family 39 protein n=1 Tax=Desulfosporosinus sp. FKB TaxID=1969835 RepID=UPI000B4A399E|nr:glycosyltransferase family 39 protein [Desulfosporosinus sp. FKB]
MIPKVKRIDPFLLGAALLAGFLNIYGIWKDQYANAYYTAAVTSMLQSFHNFFFASFDPGGFVTVDKPPVAFWVQTLFASMFGVHGWSVILPQALAGIGSVLLIYVLVKPSFGQTAARVSAFIFAFTPIAAAVSRTNNVDSLLVFTLLAAAWCLFRGARTSKPIWFMAAFALVGLGFNIKMLQAYMVLPAFYLFYWLAFKVNWQRRLAILSASTAVLLVVSFSWALVVDSIPPADRPYIGSSQTNSVLELAFGYNGLSRLTGQHGPGGNKNQRQSIRGQFSGGFAPDQGFAARPNSIQRNSPFGGNNSSGRTGQSRPEGGGFFGGGGMFNTGKAGPFRLFQSQLSGQISWLLPFALLSALGLLIGIRRKQLLTDKQKESLFWLAWLLPMMGFFSVAGFFHSYYLIMLGPSIAALSGAGWAEFYGFYRNREGWKGWLLPIGVLGTTLFQLYILWPYRLQIGSIWTISVGILGCVFSLYLALSLIRSRSVSSELPQRQLLFSRTAAIGGLLVLLAAPLYWASTPLLYGGNSMIPEAGPQLNHGGLSRLTTQPGRDGRQGFGADSIPGQVQDQRSNYQGRQEQSFSQVPGQGPGQMRENVDTQLVTYLEAHNTGEKFLFAAANAGTAEAYIIQTGKAVMAMGGFSGSDPILTVDKLKQMIAAKEVKYFLLSGGGQGRGSSDIQSWIRQNGKEVPQSAWQSGSGSALQGGRGMFGAGTLYEVNP